MRNGSSHVGRRWNVDGHWSGFQLHPRVAGSGQDALGISTQSYEASYENGYRKNSVLAFSAAASSIHRAHVPAAVRNRKVLCFPRC